MVGQDARPIRHLRALPLLLRTVDFLRLGTGFPMCDLDGEGFSRFFKCDLPGRGHVVPTKARAGGSMHRLLSLGTEASISR